MGSLAGVVGGPGLVGTGGLLATAASAVAKVEMWRTQLTASRSVKDGPFFNRQTE